MAQAVAIVLKPQAGKRAGKHLGKGIGRVAAAGLLWAYLLWACLLWTCLLWASTAGAQPVLDPAAVPGLDAAGRASYAGFVQANTPRVAALGSNGRLGWYSGGHSLDIARDKAVAACTEHGGAGCRPYAEDLAVVWPGREWRPAPAPGPLVDTINYGFVPDARFLWHGPAASRGVVVWSHGKSGDVDNRGLQPPPFLRAFNNAGFDVVRFDRAPLVDNPVRAAGWLREELPALRRSGYRTVVAAGQSRGGWTSLQALDTAGLADVVIAASPAAHGSGGSTNLLAQDDDLRQLVADAAPSRTRVAFVQFSADPFMSDAEMRVRLVERLRPKTGGLLLIDRPAGLSGHFGAAGSAFAMRFGECLLLFATEAVPSDPCAGK